MGWDYEVTEGTELSKHYAKNFQKKYQVQWEVTLDSLKQLCTRIDSVYELELCDEIKRVGSLRLLKINFAIARSKQAPRASGCRAIIVSDDAKHTVKILIAYHKSDITHINNNETLAWNALVSDLYPEYRNLLI